MSAGAHSTAAAELLTERQLNRATLARQLLLERVDMAPGDAVDHLVGMQAQSPRDPYIALWSRLVAFEPDELALLIWERRAVRVPIMRTTLHLVSARDCLAHVTKFAPLLARTLRGTAWGKAVADLDLEELVRAGRDVLDEHPRTNAELGGVLAERWPGRDPAALAWAVHYLTPLVQIPPRGVWGQSGRATWATVDAWLGRAPDPPGPPDELVLRYLGAFGPATVADARKWSGLTGLREVFERLRPQLRTSRDERGRELFDLSDAPRPDPDTPAPPRFLPEYDNLLLSHDDRSRFATSRVGLTPNPGEGGAVGSLLVDGTFRGLWRLNDEADAAVLRIQLTTRLPRAEQAAVREEASGLAGLVRPAASGLDVQFVDV